MTTLVSHPLQLLCDSRGMTYIHVFHTHDTVPACGNKWLFDHVLMEDKSFSNCAGYGCKNSSMNCVLPMEIIICSLYGVPDYTWLNSFSHTRGGVEAYILNRSTKRTISDTANNSTQEQCVIICSDGWIELLLVLQYFRIKRCPSFPDQRTTLKAHQQVQLERQCETHPPSLPLVQV